MNITAESIKNILVVSMGGIGNMVMLTPAIDMLSRRFTVARIHFLLSRNGSREVIDCAPSTGTVIEIEKKMLSLLRVIGTIRKLNPDIIFSATGTNPFNCGCIGLLSGARVRAGESFGAGRFLYNVKALFSRHSHEITANVSIARLLCGGCDVPPPRVWSGVSDAGVASTFINAVTGHSAWIGMHPGSGPFMAYKRWPAERFIELGRRIKASFPELRIILFGGAQERSLSDAAASSIGGETVSAAGRLSICQTYEVLKKCPLLICNDSGVMHLAAAAGSQVVALFGPTRECVSGPWGSGHRIIRAGECRACYHGRPVKCDESISGSNLPVKCMDAISVETVHACVCEEIVKAGIVCSGSPAVNQ